MASYPSVVDGLVFLPQWFSPAESAYGRIAKICAANAYELSRVSSAIFGVQPQDDETDAGARHSRSLLHGSWMRPDRAIHTGAAETQGSTLQSIVGGWWRELGVSSLRFCPDCLSVGFHSAMCQVAGIHVCPVHSCRLISRCQFCGASTGPYALSSELENPFACSECLRAYSDGWHGLRSSGLWKEGAKFSSAYMDAAARLEGIVSGVTWAPHGLSGSRKLGSTESESTEVLQALEKISEGGVRFATEAKCDVRPLERVSARESVNLWDRIVVLKSIRRQLLKRDRVFKKRLPQLSGAFSVAWSSEVGIRRLLRTVEPKAGASPEAAGALQWMFRFRVTPFGLDFTRQKRVLHVPPSLLTWPPYADIKLQSWAAFAWECLQCDVRSCLVAAATQVSNDHLSDLDLNDVPRELRLLSRRTKRNPNVATEHDVEPDLFLLISAGT